MSVDVYQFGVWQGSLAFRDGLVIADPATDPTFKQRVDELSASELRPYQDVRFGNDQVMVAAPMRRDDPGYSLGFLQCLERMGYEVVQRHPEVDAEIEQLAQQLPDNHLTHQKIDEILSTLSNLEKTYIRDSLRAAVSKGQ